MVDDVPTQPVVADAHLAAWIRADFGLDLTSLEPVDLGADMSARLWRGVADTAPYAIKLSRGGTPAGAIVSAHLAEHAVPGIVGPVRTLDGRLWSEHDGGRLSLVPWLADDRALHAGMTAQHWFSYGALLARTHAIAVTDELTTLLPREEHTHDRIAAAARALDRRVAAQGRGASPAHGDDIARTLVREWSDAAEVVSILLAQADVLSRQLRARSAPTVVCHGDPHLGNLLCGAANRVWLLDWDDAVLAPPERDLIFVLGGVLAFAPVTAEQQSWFFDGYGAVHSDPARLAYYRCVRALEDLTDPAAQALDVAGHPETDRADALAIVRGVLSPTGLVTLALSSLRDLDLVP